MRKRYITIGLIFGIIFSSAIFALATEAPIKLVINNKEIQCDAVPTVVQGRVMVPARYVAEALGATVSWDAIKRAVIITSSTDKNSLQTSVNSSSMSSVEYFSEQAIHSALDSKYEQVSFIGEGKQNYIVLVKQIELDEPRIINNLPYWNIQPIINQGFLVPADIKEKNSVNSL